MCVTVESLSASNTCPLEAWRRSAVGWPRAAVARVVYVERPERRPAAAPCVPAWRSPWNSTHARGHRRDRSRPTRGTTRNRIAAMSRTDVSTPRTRNSDPFSRQLALDLRNTVVALSAKPARSPKKARCTRPSLQPISGDETVAGARTEDQESGCRKSEPWCQNLATNRGNRSLHADLGSQRQKSLTLHLSWRARSHRPVAELLSN